MRIPRVFVWLSLASIASIASVVLGAPLSVAVDEEESLATRDSFYASDLSLRALTQAQIGQRASATLQKQQARKTAKAQRAHGNKARAAAGKPAAPHNNAAKAARRQQWAAAAANAKTPSVKAAKTAKRQANRAANRKAGKPKGPAGVQGARKARVATRLAENNARKEALAAARAKLNDGPKLSRPDRKKALKAAVPPKPRPVNADKAAVTQHIKNSAQKMKTMTGIPSRKHLFQSSNSREQRTGKDVRKAVMNSHLHDGAPVGAATHPRTGASIKPMPKHFGNFPNNGRPYGKPLPASSSGNYNGLKEYPVTSGGAGWHGEPVKGAVRVITDNNRNVFHGVVTHPGRTAANPGDYHKMS